MHRGLTRKGLYDLVWSKPRTELAKQFGISDVAVGKLCRQLNVPAPPPGYWAHVAAKGHARSKFVKPPLMYTLEERISEDHAAIRASCPEVDPEDLGLQLPPPLKPAEAVAEAVERYRRLVEAVPTPKPSRGQHPIVQKFVAEDDRLAALARSYSWDQPKYRSTVGKQILAGLNLLLWWWTDLGFGPSSSGTRHIRLHVKVAEHWRSFAVSAEAQSDGAVPGRGATAPFRLEFDVDDRYSRNERKPAMRFNAFDRDFLVSTAVLLIERGETDFRASLVRHHEHLVWLRKEAVEKDRAAKAAERARLKAERRALLAARESALDGALSGMSRADAIRSLARSLEDCLGTGAENQPEFDRWKRWALAKANALDIRCRSADEINTWVAAFRLAAKGASTGTDSADT